MIIAGVDGGGTKTEAICCDQTGRIVGRGSSGTSNYHNVGLDTAIKHVEAALANAGFPKPDVLCVALAAMNTSADFQVLNGRLQQIHPGAMLEHDAFAELYLGTRGKPGVLVIAGTGSVVLGYDGKERHRRCDLGWFLGDDGSGYYIGKEGLRTAARMIFEEGEETQIKRRCSITWVSRIRKRSWNGRIPRKHGDLGCWRCQCRKEGGSSWGSDCNQHIQ